eukprot:CAMPEP_0177584686 /NCGR_PEP_ID=MMETSP0419_2-20121207/4043_1 /TAXON_ID=582737 /ORGANISM="Tetraselmis sp., Strain GSL018" /LENGTH=507 /DNA_ID=CAMNT_0019074271 /DNA_START=1311 /DNA_END=2833 /DNA_ORIENTATION=-
MTSARGLEEEYLNRAARLLRHFTHLHPMAAALSLEELQRTCAMHRVADICLVVEMQAGIDALVGASYDEAAAERMRVLPAAVSETLIVPPNGTDAKSHHASTIAEVAPGELLAAWFAGDWEGANNTGIWMARWQDGSGWGPPWEVVSHVGRGAVWNPVLLQVPRSGETILFFKEGDDPLTWAGKLVRSSDGGHTWSSPEALPRGITGPAKNKPVVLSDGTILSPSSEELGPAELREAAGDPSWFVHLEVSGDGGRTWRRNGPVRFAGNIIQPSLFVDSKGGVRMLARMTSNTIKQGDFDEHWHYPHHFRYNDSMIVLGVADGKGERFHDVRRTALPCPNSGIDAVRLRDGRVLVVYNPTKYTYRGVLAVALSEDDGETWFDVLELERCRKSDIARNLWTRYPEYSYPAILQASDGLVHITYTYSTRPLKRHKSGRESIKHVVLNPLKLRPVKLEKEELPAAKFHHFLQALRASSDYFPPSYEHWLEGNNGIRAHVVLDEEDDGDSSA